MKCKNCPKCKCTLLKMTFKAGTYWTHLYDIAYLLGNKPMCDYSEKAKENKPANNRNT